MLVYSYFSWWKRSPYARLRLWTRVSPPVGGVTFQSIPQPGFNLELRSLVRKIISFQREGDIHVYPKTAGLVTVHIPEEYLEWRRILRSSHIALVLERVGQITTHEGHVRRFMGEGITIDVWGGQ